MKMVFLEMGRYARRASRMEEGQTSRVFLFGIKVSGSEGLRKPRRTHAIKQGQLRQYIGSSSWIIFGFPGGA
jgi:hypothetical protein